MTDRIVVTERGRRVVALRERGLPWRKVAAEMGVTIAGAREIYDRYVVRIRRERAHPA